MPNMEYAAGVKAMAPVQMTPGRCDIPPTVVPRGAIAPTKLTNRRFVGDAELEAIIGGKKTLSSGKGAHIRKIQAALEDLGYPLPKHHADADFGGETKDAVTLFQKAEKLVGATADTLDQPTMQRLDQRSPQASAAVHSWRETEAHRGGAKKQTRLRNPRFVGDPVLAMLCSGVGAITSGKKGAYVWKIQAALRDMGWKVNPDGDFGGLTKTAVQAFQEAYNVKSEPGPGKTTYTDEPDEIGAVNGATMAALDAYAPTSLPVDKPKASLTSKKGPKYAELFADGKFEVTLAIGYDDNSKYHIVKKAQAIAYLQRELDFKMTDPRTASSSDVSKAGLDPKGLDRELIYFTRTFRSKTTGKDVSCVVKLMTAKNDGSDGAGMRDRFRKAMEGDDAVLYTGHARAGTGPDFDPHASHEGNYKMGKGYSDKYNKEVEGADNQLDKTRFTKKYQVHQLWGCTTENYWKHIDKRLGKKGTDGKPLKSHKDIVTTTKSIPTVRGLFGTLAFLRGLLAEASGPVLADMADIGMRMNVAKTHGGLK